MKRMYFFRILLFFLLLKLTSTQAQSNQYLHFDGVDDFVQLSNASQYVNGLNTISMTGWFKNDALSYGQGTIGFRGDGSGTGQMYLLQLGSGQMECRVITNTGTHQVVAPSGTIQAGIWQHWAWIFDQNTVSLYVDGNLVGSSTASGTFTATNRPFTVGKTILPGFNFVYKGGADEVTLWNKALTQAEVQNMITNELVGNETGLVLYYKFNQGTPGGNNSNLTQVIEQTDPAKNMTLNNFALNGNTSNFIGTLSAGAQAINFPPIPDQLISNPPFQLNATTNSNLPITYTIVSGPATVSGNTVTLNGTPGTVTVKASQPGNSNWQPASDVFETFDVLDPNQVVPNLTILHPLAGNVYMPGLMPIEVGVHADIDYPALFSVNSITASVNGTTIPLTNHGNGYYTGWWTPTQYGANQLSVSGTNNYGASTNQTASLNLMNVATNTTVNATSSVWVSGTIPSETVEANLPSHIGAYTQILGTLNIDCPTGGCDPWDRVSSIDVMGKDGEWFEIIRYLTPYGVACQHSIDLTDFASLLKGKTKFRVNLGTQGNGFLYTLQLTYTAGTAQYPYSDVQKLWTNTYQFGDPANLQPVPEITKDFPPNTVSAKIKLVSTGHGWGNNNTNNAAEFSNNTHHIWVNNLQTFTQNNWRICNPNPDNCSPQSGTWFYDRAGWCPGSIAQYFDYNMNPYVTQPNVALKYVFDTSYVDNCHPNNPGCVTGVTCANCNDGFNPHLIVNSYLISYGANPLANLSVSETPKRSTEINVFPNPSNGKFFIQLKEAQMNALEVYDMSGKLIKKLDFGRSSDDVAVDIRGVSSGIYILKMMNDRDMIGVSRMVIE